MRFDLELIKNVEFRKERDARTLQKMKKLYPSASDDELRLGLDNLKTYLQLVLRIAARLARDNPAVLTAGNKAPTIKTQRSNPTQPINN